MIYCETTVTWEGSIKVIMTTENQKFLNLNSIRPKAKATRLPEVTAPATLIDTMNMVLRNNLPKVRLFVICHPFM